MVQAIPKRFLCPRKALLYCYARWHACLLRPCCSSPKTRARIAAPDRQETSCSCDVSVEFIALSVVSTPEARVIKCGAKLFHGGLLPR